MSRVGKQPIIIPDGITIDVADDVVVVKGSKGELSLDRHDAVTVSIEDGSVIVSPNNKSRLAKALWGTVRALIANMIVGVSEGYRKVLEMHGVGYRAVLQGNNLVLSVGFSHTVELAPPDGVTFEMDGNNKIIITGIDKQVVGEIAAVIRSVRPPEPYKGKGIRYEGEVVRRKVGKRAAGTQ